MPEIVFEPPFTRGAASMWMNELFSSSIRSGVPLTAARPPIAAPASDRPVTSFVDTKPPDVASILNTTPLPERTVGSPPPPSVPAWLLLHTAGIGLTYAPKPPPPWPIQTPAVRVGQPVAVPAVQRSKSPASVSLL